MNAILENGSVTEENSAMITLTKELFRVKDVTFIQTPIAQVLEDDDITCVRGPEIVSLKNLRPELVMSLRLPPRILPVGAVHLGLTA